MSLPIETLPAWCRLNNVALHVAVAKTERGLGLITRSAASPLITVPADLVLNHEAVQEYAREDQHFRQLLDAAGHESTRGDVLLFLLAQLVSAGLSNPWSEYVQFLPRHVPVPTLWSPDERALLAGTSLESAVAAKLAALESEWDRVQDATSGLAYWNLDSVALHDWILLDAWYRSRCLELPRSGEALVPCLDMANHSGRPAAYYDENTQKEVLLLPRPHATLSPGDEITISYGDAKPAAEMLFSYGFLDTAASSHHLVLPLDMPDDDPLAKAKLLVFGGPPTVRLQAVSDGTVDWQSPFAYLACANEEDGLEFRVLQDGDGGRQLRLFWRERDETERAAELESLFQDHPLRAVLRLRVVSVVQDCLVGHLQRMQSAESGQQSVGAECVRAAALLRAAESGVLQRAVARLQDEKTALAQDETVLAYLGSMEASGSDLADAESANDFS